MLEDMIRNIAISRIYLKEELITGMIILVSNVFDIPQKRVLEMVDETHINEC